MKQTNYELCKIMPLKIYFSAAIKETNGLIKRQIKTFLKYTFQLYWGIIDAIK